MTGNSLLFLVVSLLLALCMISAGCSDESPPTDTANLTPFPPVPKYSEGDIISTASSSGSSSLYIILKYDPVTDQYTRAVIEKNADGTWGHRSSEWTEKVLRATLERTYTVLAGHVAVAIVPVVTHSLAPEATTGQPAGSPVVSAISPASAVTGSTASVTITGDNFRNGAFVRLYRAGSLPRNGTVTSLTAFTITCVFDLTGMGNGNYNVMVINPDGQSGSGDAAFTVGEVAPVLSGLYPVTGAINERVPLTITGRNFRNEVKVTFANNRSELVCDSPLTVGSEKILCTLDLSPSRGAFPGAWNLTVLNIRDGTKGTWAKMFTIASVTSGP